MRLPAMAEEFLGVKFLPLAEWKSARARWATTLAVDVCDLEPGASLGPPSGRCKVRIREDVVHPVPGEIWVRAHVRDALASAQPRGVTFAPVQLSPNFTKAELWEIVVHGKAWRTGSTAESLELCSICGRTGFPAPGNLNVDITRWDGSDFVHLDGNPNIIVVTDRVATVFEANGFTNIAAEPLS
jgi:hypothetical protein